MKRLAYIPLAVLLIASSAASLSADPSNRPMGVAAADWIPVSDRLGIVLVPPPVASSGHLAELVITPMAATALILPLKPPVGGYFMVKGAEGWARLVVVEPAKGPGDAG